MKVKQLILLLTMAILMVAFTTRQAESAGARVEIPETSFNFGYVHAGGVVSHSYVLQSTGSDSLKILKVQPACGCTKAPLKKEVIATGENGEVELVFTLSAGSRGNVSKSATVYTNDSTRGTFQLQFTANAYQNPDSITPLTLSSGQIKFGEGKDAREAKLTITNTSTSPVKVQLVASSPDYFSVDLPTAEIQPQKSKEIKVKLANGLTVDEFKHSFTFEVNNQPATRYTIPVELAKAAQASSAQPVSGH